MSNFLTAQNLGQQVEVIDGTLEILSNISLDVAKGQSLAIQGASGSGKSTLLALLAGLDTPASGTVVFDGVSLAQLSEDQRADLRAQRVGFVFQSFHLMDELNSVENVALPLELFGMSKAQDDAVSWLQRLGLGHRLTHFPAQLSGGEQQRVALARAFALRPDLLFADEPTANLDTKTANSVLGYLFELQKSCGTTMVMATHDDKLAARCDNVIRLSAGKIESASGCAL